MLRSTRSCSCSGSWWAWNSYTSAATTLLPYVSSSLQALLCGTTHEKVHICTLRTSAERWRALWNIATAVLHDNCLQPVQFSISS